MGEYRRLDVWKRAHQLTRAVYEVTAAFPDQERYGLTSQIRRTAISVPANLAEGCGRNSDAELARYCHIALGSANELDYHLLHARDLKMLSDETHRNLENRLAEVRRMLSALSRRLC
jgi:four helix bundle protein